MRFGSAENNTVGSLGRYIAGVAASLLLASCSSVTLSPAAIATADVPEDERRDVVTDWREAVVIANEFLASEWRWTLPPGHYELDDQIGMTFVGEQGCWPIAVRCTTWGDLCVAIGFSAQEREDGFVVGEAGKERDRLVDNSLFVFPDSGWGMPPHEIADLILHETTHTVWREGTIGFWNGVSYYLETLFLFRYSNHSDERRPNGTDEEFGWFWLTKSQPEYAHDAAFAEYVKAHRASEHDTCRHGPFDELLPAAPLPELRDGGR